MLRTVDNQEIIAEMVRRIVERFDPHQIILFGSHARGAAGPDSDVDLLVVMPIEGSRLRCFRQPPNFWRMPNRFLPLWKNGMIDLQPDHLALIQTILAQHVPRAEVRAFGSRVTGTAMDYSDLDLVVVGREKTNRKTLHCLEEAFAESDLPFRVDVLDWHRISDSFRQVIGETYGVIQESEQHRTST